jgi:hypothetical protein
MFDQPVNLPKRVANFVSPERDSFYSALRAQQRTSDIRDMAPYCVYHLVLFSRPLCLRHTGVGVKTFQCTFFEIPDFSYESDCLPTEPFSLEDDTISVHEGTLNVDLTDERMVMGRFKTAHPGSLWLIGDTPLPPFTDAKVCVKQLYVSRGEGKGIARLKGRYELSALLTECNCLRWASLLLDLTYKFIAREIEKKGRSPMQDIPELRFTNTMIAVVKGEEKAFLVEEWIHTDEGNCQFVKYINNRLPTSCLTVLAPPNAFGRAEFLICAQHIQWQKTNFAAFTSDYQGASKVLTDPQITSNPYVQSVSPIIRSFT